jgi:hypothetical protein
MAAKMTLGWPLLVAATSINCIRRLDVIPAKRGSWRRVPKGRSPALMRGRRGCAGRRNRRIETACYGKSAPGWSVPKGARPPLVWWKGSDGAAQADAAFRVKAATRWAMPARPGRSKAARATTPNWPHCFFFVRARQCHELLVQDTSDRARLAMAA